MEYATHANGPFCDAEQIIEIAAHRVASPCSEFHDHGVWPTSVSFAWVLAHAGYAGR